MPVTPMAPAMTDVFDVTRATVTESAIAEPSIASAAVAEAAIPVNAITAAIAGLSESRRGTAGKQQSARNDRRS